MNMKVIASYVGGIVVFVAAAMLLRGRVPEEVALGLGWFAMLLVGYPFTRYISGNHLNFGRWVVFVTFGVAVGITLLRYL
jgi:hypothetical protein